MNNILALATENIAMEMAKQRISKKKAAELIGVSSAAVGSIVNDISGETNPSFKIMYAIWTEALKREPADLLKKRG